MAEMAEEYVIESPLARWPGRLTLPHPDEFSGDHWAAWQAAIEAHQAIDTINRRLAYAGMEFVKAVGGQWQFDLPLATVRSWETQPGAERLKFISWLGREFHTYLDAIVNPKA